MVMSDDEMAGNEAYCSTCGERDILDALDEVHVATRGWHRVVRYVHPECREMFVADHLPAVLESIRLGAL